MNIVKRIGSVAFGLFLLGCGGQEGPQGMQGIQGPPGPAAVDAIYEYRGQTTRVTGSAQLGILLPILRQQLVLEADRVLWASALVEISAVDLATNPFEGICGFSGDTLWHRWRYVPTGGYNTSIELEAPVYFEKSGNKLVPIPGKRTFDLAVNCSSAVTVDMTAHLYVTAYGAGK